MNPSIETSPELLTCERPVSGLLRTWVRAFVGVEVVGSGPMPLAVAPHDAWMLTVQVGRGHDGVERKAGLSRNTTLTGIRQWTGSFHGRGDCITLFAMLTPLGMVELLQSRPLEAAPRIRAHVAELLDEDRTRSLELAVAQAPTLDGKLHSLAQWMERQAESPARQCPAALRAARSAMRLSQTPSQAVERVADDEHVSRRQLERDFSRWLGTTPRHWSQVARVQAMSRQAQRGDSLADIAADLGFADQSHMSNVVKQLTGLSPGRYVRAGAGALGAAFRRVTGGGTVYL
jgi:AraC-like DNA-binding protein